MNNSPTLTQSDNNTHHTHDNHHSHTTELALFDLDNTLLNTDSDYMWGEYLVKHGLVDEQTHRQKNRQFYEQYIAGTLNPVEYNEFVGEFLVKHSMERLYDFREDYIKYDIEPNMRPKAIETIQKHQQAGHEVVIISATNDFVVSAIGKRFGVEPENILATPLEIQNNRYTGRLADKPNFQDGKLYHLNQWLQKKQKQGFHFTKTYAYSDSKNDIPLLAWADVAICVTPDDVLKEHAIQQGWQIADWSM